MTSKSFRRSRQNRKTRRSRYRRGGNVALMNAASASVLPIGLTLLQQHLKKKNSTPGLKTMRRFGRYMTPKN
jgi:hypothetical protein